MIISQQERDAQGRIMLEAERRAAARNAPPSSPEPSSAPAQPPEAARVVRAISPSQRGSPLASPRRPLGRLEIAGIALGLVITFAGIVLINRVVPAQETPHATLRPTAIQVSPTSAAPAVAPPARPTATPEPTPEPPTQTPAVIYIQAPPPPPCYSVTEDVYSGDKRAAIGQVTGNSCESQAAAQAAADALAAEMRGGK